MYRTTYRNDFLIEVFETGAGWSAAATESGQDFYTPFFPDQGPAFELDMCFNTAGRALHELKLVINAGIEHAHMEANYPNS